jgi:hypothetical protein
MVLITERVAVLCCKNLGWKSGYASRVAAAYRQFLHMKGILNDFDNSQLLPCIPVNSMWQQHILSTKNYMIDCHALFGRWIHYDFNDGAVVDSMNTYAKMMITLRLLQTNFGIHVDRELWGIQISAFVADNSAEMGQTAIRLKNDTQISSPKSFDDPPNHGAPPGFTTTSYTSASADAGLRVVSPSDSVTSAVIIDIHYCNGMEESPDETQRRW